MSKSIIFEKLNLSGLKHAKMEANGKSGKVKGIFIPIDVNKLFLSDKGNVYLDLVAFPYKEPKEYGTHLIKQSFSKEAREKMSKEELEGMPILGNLSVDNAPAEANNDAGEGDVFDEKSDLPF
jgi:hypothetical protein